MWRHASLVDIEPNNAMDNFFQIFFMGTSWVALSIKYIKTRENREMMSRKKYIFDFNGVNIAKHWHVAGEVFAISDCLVTHCYAAILSTDISIISR